MDFELDISRLEFRFASWDDPLAWRDAMLPPLTFAEALRAARKAKASRLVFRGAVFDLTEPVAKESATLQGTATADSAFNEWDEALGTHPPETRQ